jgi:hypothetical protein
MAKSTTPPQRQGQSSVLDDFPVLSPSDFLTLVRPLMTDGKSMELAAKILASGAPQLRASRAAQGKDAALALANAGRTLELRALRHELVARLLRAAARASVELLRELPEGQTMVERMELEISKAWREMAIAVPGNETTH